MEVNEQNLSHNERVPILNTDYKQIQSEDEEDQPSDEQSHLLNDSSRAEPEEEGLEFYEKLSGGQKKIFGVLVAIIGGIFFGSTFAPILYVQDNYADASKNGNDYSFSLGTGILISSMFYFIVYCAYKKNKPKIYSELILPSFTTGKIFLRQLILIYLLASEVEYFLSKAGCGILRIQLICLRLLV